MQPSLFVFQRFPTHHKGRIYFNYDGFEYRYDGRHGTFVRADGAKFYRSETFTKNLHEAMDIQIKIRQAGSYEQRYRLIQRANAKRVSLEEHKKRIEDDKRRKRVSKASKPSSDVSKSNEISWSNHFLMVKNTKTRVTSKGYEIRVGNMVITVKDKSKVEEVRKRFEDHELNKYKNL